MGIGPYRVGDIPAADLQIEVTRDGAPADLTGVTGVTGTLIAADGTPSVLPGVIEEGSVIVLDWPDTSPFSAPGMYSVTPVLTGADNSVESLDPVLIAVYPDPSLDTHGTVATVSRVTGTTVTPADIDAALSVIELVTGRDLTDLTGFSIKDTRNLRYAVAWQAAFMAANPGLMTEVAAASKSVGDVSVSYRESTANWLAPLARLALKRVLFKGNRTVLTGTLGRTLPDTMLEDSDPEHGWTPLGGTR